MTQIKQWESSFLPTLNDQPTLAYDLAQKKMVNGRPYVRVPTYGAGSECGYFYFTNKEDGTLQSMFVLVDQKVNSTLDGIVGFTDFENQSQIFVTYQNNKPVALYSVKDTKTLFASVFTKRISGSIRQQQVVSACAEQNGIIKLPDGRDSISIIKMGGGIPCPDTQTFWQKIGNFFSGIWGAITDAFDWLFSWGGGGGSGSGSGSGGSGGYTGGGFGSGGYGSWGFGGFGGGYSGSGSGGSYGGGDPNGGGWGPYDPFANNEDEEITYDDTNSGYEEPNSNSGDDVTPYDQINPSQPIPTINDIMGVTNFVKRVSSSENCFDIAKKQILKLGYYINGWDPARTTFQLYTRSAGINKNKADVGVSYMVSALKRNIPVVIGVDYGKTSGNKDHTTNHFVVVVGMGTDANGKMFFRFYDNYTAATNYGAHPLNIVTYDPNTGSLTGAFVGTRGNNPISYKVAQIRKSFK